MTCRSADAGDPAPPTEPIDVIDGADDDGQYDNYSSCCLCSHDWISYLVCSGVEEVVDLTCEGSEATVVDLTTSNDSVLVKIKNHAGSNLFVQEVI